MIWIREIAGWTLVLVALFLVRTSVLFASDLTSPRLVEAAVVAFSAIGVLRAGVALIRLATAARLCRLDGGE